MVGVSKTLTPESQTMLNFSRDVPKNPRGPALPIRRTPAQRPLDAIVTSHDLIGCYTHFYKGSTIPCEGENCKAHAEGIPFRWHAYMSCVDHKSNLHFLFEVTALGATHFTAYRDVHNGLRGCFFRAERWNRKPNGRCIFQMKPAVLADRELPPAPDLEKCLAILWSLPIDTVQTPDRSAENKMPNVQIHKPREESA